MNRFHALLAVASLATALLLLTACETPLDRAYGLSQREHVALSTQNPDAGADALEGPATDGQSSGSALYKFRTQETASDEIDSSSLIESD